MKIVRIDYYPPLAVDRDEVHDMQFVAHGVSVTVTDRPGGISVTVNPSGEPFMNRINVHEVASSGGQIRVSDARGGPDL